MMKKKLIGTRIPESVINEMKEYCKLNGILMNHFVANAIQEKLKKLKRKQEKLKEEEAS